MTRPGSSSGRPLIVFSDDWGKHPSSSQHIVRRMAGSRRIVWVNTVGMRRPRLGMADLNKALIKLAGMIRQTTRPADDFQVADFVVCQPLMLPFNTTPLIRRFNAWSAGRQLRRIAGTFGDVKPVILTTVPNSSDYVDVIPAHKIVYYCVDDFSEWPGLDKALVLDMEKALIHKADVFVATSKTLLARLSCSGKPAHLLTHGVDLELFSSCPDHEYPGLAGIPVPRAGYFGLFDDRSDKNLIEQLARKMPEVSFVIAGRVETDVQVLRSLPNVHFVGLVPYRELPMLIKGLDLLFIPYLVDELSESLSPLKLKEYLATGLPIISTPIAAAREMSDCLSLAEGTDEWCKAIAAVLTNVDEGRKRRMLQRLAGERWDEKARTMEAICDR